MRKAWLAMALVGVLAIWSPPAKAVVLYDNGSYDPLAEGYYNSNENGLYLSYDDFTLANPATISDVHWWGVYLTGPTSPDVFTYIIRTNPGGGGPPGAEIASGPLSDLVVTDTGNTLPGPGEIGTVEVYQYDADTAGLYLPAGDYYLSIIENATEGADPDSWCWCESNPSAGDTYLYAQKQYQEFEGPYPVSLAFNLTGEPVPEPATITLFGLCLAGLVGRQIRRRK
jgi:hypothetical protein